MIATVLSMSESYCSKSKKEFGDGEAVGGAFWGEQWLFSPKFKDSQPAVMLLFSYDMIYSIPLNPKKKKKKIY